MERMEGYQVSHSFLPLPSGIQSQRELVTPDFCLLPSAWVPYKGRSEVSHRKCWLRFLTDPRAVTHPHVAVCVWMTCRGRSQVAWISSSAYSFLCLFMQVSLEHLVSKHVAQSSLITVHLRWAEGSNTHSPHFLLLSSGKQAHHNNKIGEQLDANLTTLIKFTIEKYKPHSQDFLLSPNIIFQKLCFLILVVYCKVFK